MELTLAREFRRGQRVTIQIYIPRKTVCDFTYLCRRKWDWKSVKLLAVRLVYILTRHGPHILNS